MLGTPPAETSNTRWPPSCTTQNSAPVPLHPAKVTSAHLLTRPSDQTGEVVFLRSQIMTMLSRHTDTSCLLVGSMLREAGVTPSAVMGRQTSVSALLCLVSRLTRARSQSRMKKLEVSGLETSPSTPVSSAVLCSSTTSCRTKSTFLTCLKKALF